MSLPDFRHPELRNPDIQYRLEITVPDKENPGYSDRYIIELTSQIVSVLKITEGEWVKV